MTKKLALYVCLGLLCVGAFALMVRATSTGSTTQQGRVTFVTKTPVATASTETPSRVQVPQSAPTYEEGGQPQRLEQGLPTPIHSLRAGTNSLDDNNGTWFNWSGSLAIPDNGCPTLVTAPINVSGMGAVLDVEVKIVNLTHTWDSDLNIYLRGPNNVQTALCLRRGGSGDNFINTVFDDHASTPIANGTPPFTGSFIPDSPLNPAFVGINANGTWQLEICDAAPADSGRLFQWRIQLLAPPCEPPPINDHCHDVTPVALPATFTGTTDCATPDVGECPNFGFWSNVWIAFNVTETCNLVLDYCTSPSPYGNAWLNLAYGCPCTGNSPAGTYDFSTCADGHLTIRWSGVAPGTYYYPVMWDITNGSYGPYVIHVRCVPCLPEPVNDQCYNVTPVTLPAVFVGDNHCSTHDCDLPGMQAGEGQTWHAFTLDHVCDVEVNYCATNSGWNRVYIVLVLECPCDGLIYCDSFGWACPNGNARMFYNRLPVGTYYVPVLRDESVGASGPYEVNAFCRCHLDAEILAPGSYAGTTCGALDDCNAREGEDQMIAFQIPTTGQWNFTLCGSPWWDSYIYLMNACCSTILAADDDGCTGYAGHSAIWCRYLTAGTYFLDIEPFAPGYCGPFTLTVSQILDRPDSLVIQLNPALVRTELRFFSPAPGYYQVWSTVNTNAEYPTSFTLNETLYCPLRGQNSWTDPDALVNYKRYVVVHSCPQQTSYEGVKTFGK
ncbi:MAG: proprotein convertase P-domain-containing protein [bacterium]